MFSVHQGQSTCSILKEPLNDKYNQSYLTARQTADTTTLKRLITTYKERLPH